MEKRVVCKCCFVVLAFVFLAVSLVGCLTVQSTSSASSPIPETTEDSAASDHSDTSPEVSTTEVSTTEVSTTEDSTTVGPTTETSTTESSAAEAASGDVIINSANFPDDVFRSYVLFHFDTNGDGALSAPEIAAASTIILENQGVSNLKGLEHFILLTTLDCSCNRLTALDVSANMVLEDLDCSDNALTALDVSTNMALKKLDCSHNNLTALDVSANTALTSLHCSDNELTSLDVSKNTALEDLGVSVNNLTALDVSKNTALESLYCYRNHLTVLDISACPCLADAYTSGTMTEFTLLDGIVCWNYENEYYRLFIDPDTTVWTEAPEGWQQVSDTWYYYEDGKTVTGWKTIGDNTYYFKENGAMAANEWCNGYWLNSDGTWTYTYKATWRQNADGWWYGDESGWYAKNETIKIDGEDYTFDENGYMK